MPEDVVVGGYLEQGGAGGPDKTTPYHVCRGSHRGEVHVGKLYAGTNCQVGDSGRMVALARFEVLAADAPVRWIEASAARSAKLSGIAPIPGVCRAVRHDARFPGELRGGACFYTYEGGESAQTTGYEILATEVPVVAAAVLTTLRIERSPNGAILSSNGEINCPGTCEVQLPKGTHVKLNTRPDAGYAASAWGGDCTEKGTPWSADFYLSCSLVMDADRTVSASFVHSVTLAVDYPEAGGLLTWVGAGKGVPDKEGRPVATDLARPASVMRCGLGDARCTLMGPSGGQVLIKAEAARGYTLTGWSDACLKSAVGPDGSTGSCEVDLDRSKKVSAVFKAITP